MSQSAECLSCYMIKEGNSVTSGSFLRWQSCIGLPSRAKLALSLPIKGPSFCLSDRNGAGRSPEEHRKILKRTDGPILRRLTATPAGRALRCSLNVQAMLTQEPGSEMLLISACGGGFCSTSRSVGDTKANPVTLTIYSSPPLAAILQPSAAKGRCQT